MPWRQDQGNEGSRKEHFDDGDIAIVTAEYFGEGVGMIDSEAFRGTWREQDLGLATLLG